MKNKIKLLVGASAAALLVVGLSGTGAQAAKWITGSDVKNESLTGKDVKNGSLGKQELSPWVQGRLEKAGAAGKAGANGKDGVNGTNGTNGVDGKNFELTHAETFAKTTIVNIGGSFRTRATEVGEFELPAGKYLIQTDALFQHNGSTPTAAPSLQAAVRVADGSEWGVDAGTVFATFPGATDYKREAQGTTFRVIELDQAQTVTVQAFGYNADGSDAGSAGFDATISVVVQKVN